jgi:O-antigen/teichoic acid export membrane protein
MIEHGIENLYTKKIVIKNAFWLYLGFGLNKLLKILIIILSARILGPENYGAFSYAFSFLGLFFLISDWGISSLLIRDYQQTKEKEKIIQTSFTVKSLLITICTILAIFGYFILNNENAKSVYFILLIMQVLINFRDFLNTLFKAIQKMEYESMAISIESIVILIIVITLVIKMPLVISLGIAYLLGALISLFSTILFAFKYNFIKKLKFSFNKENLKYYIKNGTPLMLYGFLGFIFFSTDHLIIGYFRGMYELGLYSIATKIILNLNLIPGIAMVALLPYFSFQIFNKEKLYKIYKKIFLGIILMSLLLIIFINIFIDPLVKILLGSKYLLSIPIIKFLSWSIIFLFSLVLLDNIIFVFNKQWLNFYLTIGAALLNLILNIILVPIYGVNGAIFATLISQFLNFSISYYIVEKIIF